MCPSYTGLSVLDETDILALLAEALAADVEAVFADQTGGVGADSAGASALTKGAGSGVPDALVRHDCEVARRKRKGGGFRELRVAQTSDDGQ